MDIIYDIKFWMFVWTVLTCVFQWLLHQRLIGREVSELKKNFKEAEEKYEEDKMHRTDLLLEISKDISYIKGQYTSQDKIIKVLEKCIK